jgi:flagellar capping protein FliD
MLADLGITTGTVGLGVAPAQSAMLVDQSTDPDDILQKLNDNSTLQDALANNAQDVADIFGSAMTSDVEVIGNVNINAGITLAAPLNFSIGDGRTQATVTLGTGYHSASSVLSSITNALAAQGLGDEIRSYITDGGFLRFVSSVTTGQPKLSIQDVGTGSNLATVLGVGSQTATGKDASSEAGLSRRLDALLTGFVGTDGIIRQKIMAGGLIDQDLSRINKTIDDYEYRLSLYQTRLQNQFSAMEVALAQFQTTSQFLTDRANAESGSTGTSSSSSSLTSLSL